MEDRITFGVFWKTKLEPHEWQLFAGWFDSYADAVEEAMKALKNPRSLKVMFAERVETIQAVAIWENDDE